VHSDSVVVVGSVVDSVIVAGGVIWIGRVDGVVSGSVSVVEIVVLFDTGKHGESIEPNSGIPASAYVCCWIGVVEDDIGVDSISGNCRDIDRALHYHLSASFVI
jgi:hypothetical protein